MFYMKSAPYAFKPAAAVVSCRRGGASASFDRLNKYFTIARMPVVSSQYWNSIHGNNAEEAVQDAEKPVVCVHGVYLTYQPCQIEAYYHYRAKTG